MAEFPEAQIKSLKELLNMLMAKYPITLDRVVGHEHVAPNLKIDPGPAFPWEKIK